MRNAGDPQEDYALFSAAEAARIADWELMWCHSNKNAIKSARTLVPRMNMRYPWFEDESLFLSRHCSPMADDAMERTEITVISPMVHRLVVCETVMVAM